MTFATLRIAILLAASGLHSAAHGGINSDNNVKWTHYGVRPLAMGNAYVGVADDYNALFYNPAGLARLNDWSGEFLNFLGFDISSQTIDFLDDVQDLASSNTSDNSAVISLIQNNSGTNHYMRLFWTPHLVFPGFGFGLGLDVNASLLFKRYPSVFLDAGPRAVLPIAFGFNFLENRLAVGLAVKGRFRGGIYNEFTIDSLEAFTSKSEENTDEDNRQLSDFIEGGYGVGFDMGFLFTPTHVTDPTIGLSITDLGGTQYEKADIGEESVNTPEGVLPSVNLGLSFKPVQKHWGFFRLSLDSHSINQPFDFSKKLHLGGELALGSSVKVQTGLHQGYLTGGIEVDVGLLALRMATYAEELGKLAGQIQDRRYIFQLKLLI